jgi:hypothetical protein
MIAGWVISKSFEGLTGAERQRTVWGLFEKYLDEKDRARLGIFLTFTPLEKRMAFDDNFDEFEGPAKKRLRSVRKRMTTAKRARSSARNKHSLARQ